MTKQELYLKTIFCCMACDGDIAQEEIDAVKETAAKTSILENLDVENILNTYVSEINKSGLDFLKKYLNELSQMELTKEEQLTVVDISIKIIEADKRIEYSEVKFFKKIRSKLSVSDEEILKDHPGKEDFLLPDINVEEPVWENIIFENINFSSLNSN